MFPRESTRMDGPDFHNTFQNSSVRLWQRIRPSFKLRVGRSKLHDKVKKVAAWRADISHKI